MRSRLFFQPSVLFVSWCLLVNLLTVEPVNAQASDDVAALYVVVLEAEGSLNNIKTRTAREPIVRVEDENHRPVAGAVVTFLAPQQGPSGTFLNGFKNVEQVTDMKGIAASGKFRPNTVTGQFVIQVSASYNGKIASAVINQTNILPPPTNLVGLSAKTWLIIASLAAAGAASAGVVVARGGGGGTTITPGGPTGPTVGAPR
jgi:hypothetical protein